MIEKVAPRIRVLDAHVANKIAAGEVVERPASVVKELVENALDAHATRIEVHLEKGGTRLVRVVDDGWGMAPEDLALAFLPHATSKLGDVDDLESIATLGFRGEALASIGAISQARVVSRTAASASGFAVENRGGRIEAPRPAGAAPGTEVTVRDLFFNTPARARFLRADRTELGHVEDLVRRFALAFPEVGFRLVHDGQTLLDLPSGEDRRGRLRALVGPDLADRLLHCRTSNDVATVEAYLAPPDVSRPHARDMLFFCNGRFIRDRVLHRVVRDAYRDALHAGRSPVVFLFLEIDPAQVDVNVHPTKAEVRWRDPHFLHAVVGPALSRTLREADLTARFEGSGEERREGVRAAMEDYLRRARGGEPDRVYEGGARGTAAPASGEAPAAPRGLGSVRAVQVHDSYLVCEVQDGIAIVDQHALHERVQYDRTLRKLGEGGVEAQRLLVPEEVDLEAADLALLEEHRDLLGRCGIEWSPFGGRSVAVEALPVVVPRERAAELVRDLLELLHAQGSCVDARTLFHDVADTLACKAAVRFGDRLSSAEALALLEESGALDAAFVCPHGRPTVLRLTFADLEKHFRRR